MTAGPPAGPAAPGRPTSWRAFTRGELWIAAATVLGAWAWAFYVLRELDLVEHLGGPLTGLLAVAGFGAPLFALFGPAPAPRPTGGLGLMLGLAGLTLVVSSVGAAGQFDCDHPQRVRRITDVATVALAGWVLWASRARWRSIAWPDIVLGVASGLPSRVLFSAFILSEDGCGGLLDVLFLLAPLLAVFLGLYLAAFLGLSMLIRALRRGSVASLFIPFAATVALCGLVVSLFDLLR